MEKEDTNNSHQHEMKLNIDPTHKKANPKQNENIPRLNGKLLNSGSFIEQNISIIGKYLESLKNGNIKFIATDDTTFVANMNKTKEHDKYKDKFIEIRGHVEKDNVITAMCYQVINGSFHPPTWNKNISLQRKFKDLF